MDNKRKAKPGTIGERLEQERELLEKYTLEELEANPDLLHMVPEGQRAEWLKEQRSMKEIKISARKTTAGLEATWDKIKEEAMNRHGISEQELNELLLNSLEANRMPWGEFMDRSMTAEERFLIGGLLDSILQKSKEEDRPVNEIVQDIQDALERGETPKITIKRPDSVEYPVDKINSAIWNLLKEDTGGQLTFAAEKKGSKTPLDILYSIDFNDLQETGINITKKLSPTDKRIYIAVSALFNAGNSIITLTQIHYAMGNTKRPAQDQLQKIRNSVVKMLTARIIVDNTSEAEVYTKYGLFKYNGVLLPVEFVEQYSVQGSLTEAAIHIFREPPLISFSKQRKQITTVPIKVLQSPLNKTEAHLAIDDYLIERISRIKTQERKKQSQHGSGRILYRTICDHANISGKQKQRLPGTVQRYLEHYKECEMITRYTQAADGVTVFF